MKWITRENANVDRIACPLLIKRFVDPQAEFVYVAADQVMTGVCDRRRPEGGIRPHTVAYLQVCRRAGRVG